MNTPSWTLQDAKNRFSAVVDAALQGTAQRVTRRGRDAVVVIATREYERLLRTERTQADSLGALLLNMPQGGDAFERMDISPRDAAF